MLTRSAPADAVSRFDRDVAALIGTDDGHRFGLAVSGGPDSIAMLLLAESAFPGRIAAATVEHGLREAGRAEAMFVARLCKARGIAHRILPLVGLRPGNVSAAARDARYEALGEWAAHAGLDWLLTAHHADDQLETMIMRLNRASGVGGLAGVRPRRGRVVRPLLGWRRDELHAVVTRSGVTAIEDPSNRDDRYDRARLRKALADAAWLDPVAAASSASALADADDALNWMTDALRTARFRQHPDCWSYDATGLPPELARRALIDCIVLIDPEYRPRGAVVQRLLARLATGRTATVGALVCTGAAGSWTFRIAPPRRANGAGQTRA